MDATQLLASEQEDDSLIQIEIPDLTPAIQDAQPANLASGELQSEEIPQSNFSTMKDKPSEYALHILFTQFVRYTERKLNGMVNGDKITGSLLVKQLSPGTDKEFDQILMSLAHVARRNPRPVIDSIMYWRKSKTDLIAAATSESYRSLAESRSLVSIYILTRALIEIINQTPPEVLGSALSEKLEETVFKQLMITDPRMTQDNPVRLANWLSLSQLLGDMSAYRFASVNDRFISELEKVPREMTKDQESTTIFLVEAMAFIKVKLYPVEYLEDSANFFESISKFYERTTSQALRDCYAAVASGMLEAVAENSTAEVNHPAWSAVIERLHNHAIASSKKASEASLALAAMTLCVSPQATFVEHWLPLVESQWNRSKSKWNPRQNVVFVALARLIWTSAHRCTESLNVTRRKLEVITKLLLSFSRKYWSLLDESAVNATVSILVSAFCLYPQYALDEMIFPMLTNIDAAHNMKALAIGLDGLIPEKAVIAVQAFAQCMIYTKSGARPKFPSTEALRNGFKEVVEPATLNPVIRSASLETSMNLFCHCLGRMLTLLTQHIDSGDYVSFQNSLTQLFGINVGVKSESVIYWLEKIISSAALWATDLPKYWHVIFSQLQSPDVNLSGSAYRAILEMAETCDVLAMISIQSKSLFTLDSRILTSQTKPPWLSLELELELNAELVHVLIRRLTSQARPLFRDPNDIALSTVWSLLEEIEGNAFYFLCSQFRNVRCAALRILRLTSDLAHALEVFMQFGQSCDQPTSSVEQGRVFSFFEETEVFAFTEYSSNREHYSVPEKSRLANLNSKKRTTIARLASSDYGVDSAIWLKIFPYVITQCFENYPMPVAIARNIICSRLVQMHDIVISVVENDYEKILNFLTRSSARGHTEAIIEQWRIFLMLACATLTITEEQKLYVPTELGQPGHGRKKSTQKITLHHQRITSARSVFKIVFPLLSVNHVLIREAVVSGLSCVNVNTYQTLLECLREPFERWQSILLKASSPNSAANLLPAARACTEVVHILMRTAHNLKDPANSLTDNLRSLLLSFLDMCYDILICKHIQIDANCQYLRRYFCGFLSDLLALYNVELLGLERQQRFFRLILGWSTYGRYAEEAARREATMRKASLAAARDAHERSLYLASLDFDNRKFDIATSRALSYLLLGSQSDESILDHLDWLHALLSSSQEVLQYIGVHGLERLILSNNENQMLIDELVTRCYKSSSANRVSKIYFQGLSTVFLENLDKLENIDPLSALACAVFKLGSDELHQREYAIRLMTIIGKLYDIEWPVASAFKARSSSRTTRRRLIYEHSKTLATKLGSSNLSFFTALTDAFPLVALQERRDLISALLPWVQNTSLLSTSPGNKPIGFDLITADHRATTILCRMVRLTDSFGLDLSYEIEALWMGICTGEYGQANAETVCEFLMGLCLLTKSVDTISVAKQIFTYLAGSPAEGFIVERLLQYLEPKWSIFHTWKYQDGEIADKIKSDAGFGPTAGAGTSSGLPHTSDSATPIPLSYCQLSILTLIDISSLNELILANLPAILHVCVSIADHYIDVIQKGAQNLLGSLVTVFSIKETEKDFAVLDQISGPKCLQWRYDDMSASSNTKFQGSIAIPDNMVRLVRIVVSYLGKRSPNLEQVWAREALRWATTCPVRHIACRSFQLFRILNCTVDQRMLADMLARLSTTLAESAPETQGFAIQILMTLNSLANIMNAESLRHTPQLFWATMAALGTTNEREYVEALSTANKLLQRWEFHDSSSLSLLASTFPAKWEGGFKNVQSYLLLGLRTRNAYELAHEVLLLLSTLPPSELLRDEHLSAILLAINLPRFLQAMDLHSFDVYKEVVNQLEKIIDADLQQADNSPGKRVNVQSLNTLRRILTSFVNGRFWSRHDFLQQYAASLAAGYPDSLSEIIVILMSTLSIPTTWIKVDTMAVLKVLIPLVDFQSESRFSNSGADLVSPLLRLLQTDLAELALDILDEASNIVGNQMDKHILRMSLGSRHVAKDYEHTSSMFGIPDENGWSVPQPAVAATIAKNNIHAVFYTCDTNSSEIDDKAMYFDFQREEEYKPEITDDNTRKAEAMPGVEMGVMQTMLEDLDTFFTTNVPKSLYGRSYPGARRRSSSGSTESTEQKDDALHDTSLFDQRVAHLLDHSLSISSNVQFGESFDDHSSELENNMFQPFQNNSYNPNRRYHHGSEELGQLALPDILQGNSLNEQNSLHEGSPGDFSSMSANQKFSAEPSESTDSQSKFRLEKLLGVRHLSKKSDVQNPNKVSMNSKSSPNAGKMKSNFQFP